MWVVLAEYKGNYAVCCEFINGVVKTIDLKNVTTWDDPRTAELKDLRIFSKVTSFQGRLLWPNYFSLCANYLFHL